MLLVGVCNGVLKHQLSDLPDPAPEGFQVRIFSTPRGPDGRKFLRLHTLLTSE